MFFLVFFPPLFPKTTVSWKYKRWKSVGTCKMLASYLRESRDNNNSKRMQAPVLDQEQNKKRKEKKKQPTKRNPRPLSFPLPNCNISTSLDNLAD